MIQARRSAIRTMTHSGSKAGTGQKLSRSSPASGGSGPGILTVWRKQGTRDPTPCTVSFQGCAGIPVRSFSAASTGKVPNRNGSFLLFLPLITGKGIHIYHPRGLQNLLSCSAGRSFRIAQPAAGSCRLERRLEHCSPCCTANLFKSQLGLPVFL